MIGTTSSARPDLNTYWVVEGRFLAGEYPGACDPAEAREKIAAFQKAGISTFIDLTESYELAPYEPLLADAGAEYHRFPIRDVSVPRDVRYMQDAAHPPEDKEDRVDWQGDPRPSPACGLVRGEVCRKKNETFLSACAEIGKEQVHADWAPLVLRTLKP